MKFCSEYRGALKGMDTEGILKWTSERFGSRVALATSFGAEDQVLTDLWAGIGKPARIFTLDTGRFFQETYDVMSATLKHYRLQFKVYMPNADELAPLIEADGPNLFYESIEKRKACCAVRKTKPLMRALSGLEAWVTGLRKEQSITRTETEAIEWDEAHGLYKISPLHDWTESQVWAYIRDHKIPFNALHEKGFRSIGCAPCTRAAAPGEDLRAGRWWWEMPEYRECGLHNRPKRG
jgi:phosphoadenosine phosphosulfate reductase